MATVLITGCSSGIGHATVARLAKSGRWTVYASARRVDPLVHYHPHDLRHRRLSLWHAQAVTARELAARAGHSRASMSLDVYSHVLIDGDDEWASPRCTTREETMPTGTLYGIDLSEPTQENIDALVALELGARRAAISFADVLNIHWRELTAWERQTCREALEEFNWPHREFGMLEYEPFD
jgi:NAD(P)-dependent dehydrogenase (short-subunit alcohol dehydrogenase family)